MLLGVKAVIAESFERIHRSNLIGMGVRRCSSSRARTRSRWGSPGREVFAIEGLSRGDAREVKVTARPDGGQPIEFTARLRIDTPKEREYYRHGGILQYVLRQLAGAGSAPEDPAPATAAPALPRARLALFDLDGTLTRHDTLLPYVMRLPAPSGGASRVCCASAGAACLRHPALDRGGSSPR